mmetsp:Transcript_65418/g.121999  ORF Transcript_65418/g.121999 Transcript_65418/m.121999 type:complete len:618 (-) Transcript_65418:43-1896(-)
MSKGQPGLSPGHQGVPRPTYTSPTIDVRVGNDPLWTDYNLSDLGSISLREILGGELVTFGEHIGPPLDTITPIPPKAVYVQCQQADPVTGHMVPLVVPAQLCLDVFLDGSSGAAVPENEHANMSIEGPPEEQSDRRKLRSSIKGDPILMRSKPARPPEPYIAAASQEGQSLQAPATRLHPQRPATVAAADEWGVSERSYDRLDAEDSRTSWQHDPDQPALAADDGERLEGGSQGSQSEDVQRRTGPSGRLVEHKSTVSSFIKAGGRDRYCRPRLREIDSILERVSAEPRTDAAGYPAAAASQDPGRMIAQLAAQMPRFPQFHESRTARRRRAYEQQPDEVARQGSLQFNAVVHSRASSGERLSQEVSGTALMEGQSSSSIPLASERPMDGERAEAGDSQLRTPRKQDRKNGQSHGRGSATPKLRMIDPHLPAAGLPTQRLHANWPFGIKREIARHFYGMTAEEVAAEEEHERQVEEGKLNAKAWTRQTSSLHSKEESGFQEDEVFPDGKAGSANEKKRRKQAAKRLGHTSRHGPQNNYVAHRLEVRVRNIDRPERFVVAKCTPRLKSKKEAMCRQMEHPCLELAQAAARFHEEGARSRSRCTVLYRDDVGPNFADAS